MAKKQKIRNIFNAGNLSEQISKTAEGLYYISETDAEILPFFGTKADSVTSEILLNQISASPDAPVEERSFSSLFERLTKIQDWFGDEEKQTAARFTQLKELLERNLKDLKVFRIGKIELEIYVVGLDKEGNLAGIKTKAVET